MKKENIKKCILCKKRLVKKHILPICDHCKRKAQNFSALVVTPIVGLVLKSIIHNVLDTKKL